MVAAGWISDHLFAGKAQRVCAIEMGLVAICMIDTISPLLFLIILAMAGFFLYGPQVLLGVVAFKQATKKAAASAVGFIGLMSYASVLFTGIGLGWFSDEFGWGNLYILMAGVAVIGGVLVSSLWNIQDDGYIHNDSF